MKNRSIEKFIGFIILLFFCIIICSIIVYGIFSFFHLTVNSYEWPKIDRGLFIFSDILLVVLFIFVYVGFKNDAK